jgi:hypothetical protein
MQQLQSICNTILDVKNKGACLIVRDDYTLILLDYDGLDSKQTMLITDQFPDVTVSVHESNTSKSGYCVLITRSAGNAWYRQRYFMQGLATCAVVLLLLVSTGTIESTESTFIMAAMARVGVLQESCPDI